MPLRGCKGQENEMRKRGRKSVTYDYQNQEDYKALKGPVGPGDTYGIKMSAVN